jgi:hypothetical protein
MTDEPTRVVLPDGTVVWARIAGAERLATGGGSYVETGFGEQVAARVEGLTELVRGLAGALRDATRRAGPDEVSVEFGIDLTAAPGKIVGMLAGGEAKAAITVTLTWNGSSRAAEPEADRSPR